MRLTLNDIKMLMAFVDTRFGTYLYQAFEDEGTGTDGQNEGETDDQNEGGDDAGRTYTEAELNAIIDKIVNKRLARERSEADKKTKAAAEAARLEKLTAEQKLQEKADALQQKIDELEEKEARAEMAKSARKMLADEKITLPDEIVSVLITTEAETTKTNVDSFVTVFKAAVQDAVKEALKGKTPKTGATVQKTTMTRDEIMAIKDPAKRRQAINDNIQLFKP